MSTEHGGTIHPHCMLRGYDHAVQVFLSLLPIIVLEVLRVIRWSESCRLSALNGRGNDGDESKNEFRFLPVHMDSMTILFSKDIYSPAERGSSLQVWSNVNSSVVALESGLIAMRCMHTVGLASDLAFDVMSLGDFAVKVKEKGIQHGLSLLVMDIMEFQSGSNGADSSDSAGSGRSYSKTTMKVVKNAQVISQNLKELVNECSTDGNLDILNVLIGRGWLW